ncbi:MAG: type II secretion system F family protein [Anaerolineales bacterium]|nr:type II secretion system F family protein [Anaerolineales bacterium]
MDTTTLILIGLAGVGMLLVLGAVVALVAGGGSNRVNVDERLEQFTGSTEWEVEAEDEGERERRTVADQLDKAIGSRGFSFFDRIKERIARADMKLRVTEYIALVVILALVVGGVAYFVTGSAIGAVVGAVVAAQVPRIYAGRAATKRLQAFDGQLSDTLNLWVNALRSGFSVMQGMEAIAAELPPPVSKEFERIIQEIRLGISMEDALSNSLRRVPSEDYDLVITAVNIQREVGGNLAEILDIISFTIRERVRIKGEIRTLTAQGRASGWIITLLPLGLSIVLYLINPDYITELIVNEPPYVANVVPCGWIVVGAALLMIGLGGFAIQKIVDIEI